LQFSVAENRALGLTLSIDGNQAARNGTNTMTKQTKLNKITEIVYSFPKAKVTKFQAAEIASHILSKSGWSFEDAAKSASNPFIMSAGPVWQ